MERRSLVICLQRFDMKRDLNDCRAKIKMIYEMMKTVVVAIERVMEHLGGEQKFRVSHIPKLFFFLKKIDYLWI